MSDRSCAVLGADEAARAEHEELVSRERFREAAYRLLGRLWIGEVDEPLWRALRDGPQEVAVGFEEFDDAYESLVRFVAQEDERAVEEGPRGHGGLDPLDPSYGSPAFRRDERPDVLRRLAADYAVICRGVSRSKGADPYESVHRNLMGLMYQDEWEDVLRFYRKARLTLSDSAVEPEDHLGYELECMAELCRRGLEAFEREDAEAYEEQRALQTELLRDHLLKWVPRFTEKVRECAATDFYRSVAALTDSHLAMEEEMLG